MSNHKQFEPIVKTLLEELQCPIKHNGLDLKLKRDHARVSPLDRGPESYEITNQGRPFGGVDVFPAKKVEALLDDLIIKYYEHKGSVKGTLDNAQTAAANITTDLVIKDGKYLSKITDTKEGFRFHVKEGVVITEEVKQIADDLWNLLAIAKAGIEQKTMQVNDKMKMGTLDSFKSDKKLGIWTPEGFVEYKKDQVPKKLLTSSIWFILRLHQGSKYFLNYINLEVEYKGYKAEVRKGEVHLKLEGHSELVKDIYTDLRRINAAS